MMRIVWKAACVVAVGLAGCRESSPIVEPMEVPTVVGFSARTCGEVAGFAQVWDFSSGQRGLSGGRLEKSACLTAGGLACANVTNELVRAGYWLNGISTPEGAFLFEADVVFGDVAHKVLHREREGFLWDDMGVNYKPKRDNRGLQIVLRQGPAGSWSPVVHLGLGSDTFRVLGPASRRFKPNEIVHLAIFYGANGRVVIEFGGQLIDTQIPVRGPLVRSGRDAVIGSRQVSYYHHFDGVVRRLSITPIRQEPFAVSARGPRAFLRGDAEAKLELLLANVSNVTASNVRAVFEQFCGAGRVRRVERAIGDLSAKGEAVFELPIESRVKPGWHPVRVSLSGTAADGTSISFSSLVRYGIGSLVADGMVSQMWGFNDDVENLARIGFTHGLSYSPPGMSPSNPEFEAMLDEALVRGVRITRRMNVVYPQQEEEEKYLRRTRNGRLSLARSSRVPEVSNPKLQETIRKVAEADAEHLACYPAFAGVLPFSEHREEGFPSFNTEHLRYKAETGRDVPETVASKSHTWRDLAAMKKRYPTGVIPDDDPELLYYRWYWSGGDGWPDYISSAASAYGRRIKRPDFFTFWDPAVRAPAHWGSGGSVDMLNQWCYALPEPMNVAGPCEEMFAMAEGRPGQKVSIMTQLICYRSWLAPKGTNVSPEPEWVRRLPDAEFPTIPPDHLQEAVWSMIAKPVQAIMFHGWGTIHDTGEKRGYCFTNPETRERLTEILTTGPVATLGPTLKRLGRPVRQVAVFESFTSTVFGGPASWGWKAPAITFLQRARLDPRVVYEEKLLRDGFDGIRVLYAPQCVFLTPRLIGLISDFQKKGGILIADKSCVSALNPDILVPEISFDPPPDSDHAAEVNAQDAGQTVDSKSRRATVRAKSFMLECAEKVRNDLAQRGYRPVVDSSTAEIVTYERSWKGVPYVFAVNDRRTFGDYVGAWGRTMEKGLPCEGSVSVDDPEGRVAMVYELSRGGERDFTRQGDRVVVPVKYETNDGRLFAFLPERIAAVEVDAPGAVSAGDRIRVRFVVKGASGNPVPALLPVEIHLRDAAGNELDGAGYACAVDGVCEMELPTNLDDDPRGYRLVCRDRASGFSVERLIGRR